jgi:hypothetical protein
LPSLRSRALLAADRCQTPDARCQKKNLRPGNVEAGDWRLTSGV